MNGPDLEYDRFTHLCWTKYYDENLISLFYLDKQEGVLILPPPTVVVFYLIGLWETINNAIDSSIDTHEEEEIIDCSTNC